MSTPEQPPDDRPGPDDRQRSSWDSTEGRTTERVTPTRPGTERGGEAGDVPDRGARPRAVQGKGGQGEQGQDGSRKGQTRNSAGGKKWGGAAKRERREIPAGPPPDATRLREVALNHLARFSSTERNLVQVLKRRVGRWAQRAGREGMPAEQVAAVVARAGEDAATVAAALVQAGAVDDAAFAAARTRRLARAGRSRRATAAHLAAKGIDPALASQALEETETDEMTAALAHLKRRRQGPFARASVDEATRLKALSALARAGFPREVAERALDTDPAEAEEHLLQARRG